jgi:hypothetical protein
VSFLIEPHYRTEAFPAAGAELNQASWGTIIEKGWLPKTWDDAKDLFDLDRVRSMLKDKVLLDNGALHTRLTAVFNKDTGVLNPAAWTCRISFLALASYYGKTQVDLGSFVPPISVNSVILVMADPMPQRMYPMVRSLSAALQLDEANNSKSPTANDQLLTLIDATINLLYDAPESGCGCNWDVLQLLFATKTSWLSPSSSNDLLKELVKHDKTNVTLLLGAFGSFSASDKEAVEKVTTGIQRKLSQQAKGPRSQLGQRKQQVPQLQPPQQAMLSNQAAEHVLEVSGSFKGSGPEKGAQDDMPGYGDKEEITCQKFVRVTQLGALAVLCGVPREQVLSLCNGLLHHFAGTHHPFQRLVSHVAQAFHDLVKVDIASLIEHGTSVDDSLQHVGAIVVSLLKALQKDVPVEQVCSCPLRCGELDDAGWTEYCRVKNLDNGAKKPHDHQLKTSQLISVCAFTWAMIKLSATQFGSAQADVEASAIVRCVQVMKVIRAETLQLLPRFGELDATQVFAKKPAQWLGGVFPLSPLGWAALIRWSGKEGCQSGVAQNVLAALSAYSANNHATSSLAAPSAGPRSGKKTPAARSDQRVVKKKKDQQTEKALANASHFVGATPLALLTNPQAYLSIDGQPALGATEPEASAVGSVITLVASAAEKGPDHYAVLVPLPSTVDLLPQNHRRETYTGFFVPRLGDLAEFLPWISFWEPPKTGFSSGLLFASMYVQALLDVLWEPSRHMWYAMVKLKVPPSVLDPSYRVKDCVVGMPLDWCTR